MYIEVQPAGSESSSFVILRKYDFNFRFNARPLVLFYYIYSLLYLFLFFYLFFILFLSFRLFQYNKAILLA